MSRKSGLGKGLDALIPPSEFSRQDESISDRPGIKEVSVENISPNPRQPRVKLDPEDLDELTASIRKNGIIQPLIVTRTLIDGSYTLIVGERRLRAARQAGLHTVPVIIRSARSRTVRACPSRKHPESRLTPLEGKDAYRQLVEDFGLTHEEVADRRENRVSVTNISAC
jgi:ParB family chromosome partitioning protein